MSVFIFDVDMVFQRHTALYKIFINEPLAVFHLSECQLDNPKGGRGRLRELFIAKFKSKFERSFTKVVVSGAGRLRE